MQLLETDGSYKCGLAISQKIAALSRRFAEGFARRAHCTLRVCERHLDSAEWQCKPCKLLFEKQANLEGLPVAGVGDAGKHRKQSFIALFEADTLMALEDRPNICFCMVEVLLGSKPDSLDVPPVLGSPLFI